MTDRINLPEPRAWSALRVEQVVGWRKVMHITLEQDEILLYDGRPIAVRSGGMVSAVQTARSSAQTNALHHFVGDGAMMYVSAAQFDFTIGQVLTRAGLPLTRMETQP